MKVGDSLGQAAAAEGWAPDPELLELVAEAVAATAEPRVAIVSRSQDHALERVLGRTIPDAQVTTLAAADDARDRHLMLAARGPMDLVVDLAGGSGTKRRFQDQLFHTKPGGTLLCRIPKQGKLLEFMGEIQELRTSDGLQPPTSGRGEQRPMRERDRHALAASLRRLEVRGDFALAVNDVGTLAKLREGETNRFLDLRPEAGRVIARVPGVEFPSACALRVSAEDGPPFPAPATYSAPEVSLRQYRRVECRARQVAIHDNVVLPATYRHNAKPRLRNHVLLDWAPEFVRRPAGGTTTLAGDYFYLDNQHRGHFGHALTEQISQLWGWRLSKEQFPNLRALVFERPGYPMADWEYRILEAGGIPRDDVHVAREPVSVESLVVASPMFSMPDFVHSRISETYKAMGDELDSQGTIDTWPARVFCSRRGRRAGHNKDEIEQTFVDAGFRIMYPEDLSLGDQVRLVRRAEVIAGFAGSGMFQTAFSARPKHVILVGSESYTGSNEYMIASVLGHRLDVVLCRPDVPRVGRFTAASYHSNFTYDPEREGRFLQRVLAEL
jgi:capsular polysaccharide biosynthesis protein